jgi:hypothetical protein
VNRHKDHDSGGRWGFRFEVQEIDEYPGETSLVPVLDGEVPSKGLKLTDFVRLALDALNEALARVGSIPPASPDIPEGVACVTVGQWQEYVERLGGGDVTVNGSKERKAFDRAKRKLEEEQLMGIWGAYVWVM